jgi:hypothetical protein
VTRHAVWAVILASAAAAALTPLRAAAQAAGAPILVGPLQVEGSMRVRLEAWDWFTPSTPADHDYAFGAGLLRSSVGMVRPSYDWQVELAAPMLAGLPENAVAPAPQGQLGLGATYRVENGNRRVGLLPKQAFFRLRLGHTPDAPSLRLGRFEFNDGQETQPRNPTLAWLKRERISQRLIGNFGFSHVGRSLDGVQFKRTMPSTDITVVAARPTEGVFQLNGLGELDVELAYAALTRSLFGTATAAGSNPSAEARLFAIYYRDGRDIVKTDNRPSSLRSGDLSDINIATFGAHYLHTANLGPGKAGLLLWGAVQVGDWGALRHRAHAYAVELGYRFVVPASPWLRVGYFRGSGDDSPADGSHNTFFEIIPTPRPYARLPFYNLMNVQDGFVQVLLSPTPRLALRADAHLVRLAAARDLWYSGGGAFDQNSFGYTGRPSGGAGDLARLIDLSADYQITPQFNVTLYAGRAMGKDVIRSIYPAGSTATFGYLEVMRRF